LSELCSVQRADDNKEVRQLNDSVLHSWLQRRGALTLSVLIIVILLLAWAGEPARELLRYQRAAVLNGEYWRLLSAHLVHGSWQHVGVNLAGLLLMVALFHDGYRYLNWCWIVGLSVAAIDLGFLLFMPQLVWYVGLSGVLHGLLAAGAIAWWKLEDRRLAATLSLIMVGKLAWEQWHGALPLSGELPVVINAHLYGALGGLLGGLLSWRSLPVSRRPRSVAIESDSKDNAN